MFSAAKGSRRVFLSTRSDVTSLFSAFLFAAPLEPPFGLETLAGTFRFSAVWDFLSCAVFGADALFREVAFLTLFGGL